ncbi:MAG: hypothetical protein V3V05_01500 [Pontiella sp.]
MIKLIILLLLATTITHAQVEHNLPKGLMLNLDFEEVSDGLIPSKTLYPMFVPLNELGIESFNNRNMLAFQFGQGLDIPHSSLLDPNGDEWIISVRAFPLTDGIIVSQSNEKNGYVIYMEDGFIAARIRTGHSAFTLQESPDRGFTKYKSRWVTIELRIKKDTAILSMNRKRVSMVRLQPALAGDNLHIRLGNHNTLPSPLKNTDLPPSGFTGAINSFKIIRQ